MVVSFIFCTFARHFINILIYNNMKISHIEHLGIVLCNRSSRGPESEDRLPKVRWGKAWTAGADITWEHHSEVARQGQQGCSPRSILHWGRCCQRIGWGQREGRTPDWPGSPQGRWRSEHCLPAPKVNSRYSHRALWASRVGLKNWLKNWNIEIKQWVSN